MPTQNRVGGAGGLLVPRALLRSHMAPSRALGVLAALLLLLAGAAAKPAKRSSQGPNWTEGERRADTTFMWKMQQPGSKAGAPPAAAAAHLPPAACHLLLLQPAAAPPLCSVQHSDGAYGP